MRCPECDELIDVPVENNDHNDELCVRINDLASRNGMLENKVRDLSEQLHQAAMTVEKLEVCDCD